MIASGFSWFHLIPAVDHDTLLASLGVHHHTAAYLHSWLACFSVIGVALVARMGLERARSKGDLSQWFADEGLTLRTVFELLVAGMRYFMDDLLDKRDVRTFLPFIGTLFLYIFACNIMGIFPGLLPPTDYISTNAGMAVISVLVFTYVGLSRDGVGFVKHLFGPVWWLAPLMFVIEMLSVFLIRPYSLSLRLAGNLFGDHTVFTIMSDLVPLFVPVIFLGLACLVSTIQAFVFSLLTVIYIHLSLPHHDHDEAHAH